MTDLDAKTELIMQYFSGAQLTVKVISLLAAEILEVEAMDKGADKLDFMRERWSSEWENLFGIAEREAAR